MALVILNTIMLMSCVTTVETDIHLVIGPEDALFPFGVRTASAIRIDIDRADMLVRYAHIMRNVAPDNAALLLEAALNIASAGHAQPNISQEQLGIIPYYSSPALSFTPSIRLANLYIDIAQTLYSIDHEDELNREIIIETLQQSLLHLKLITHSTAHSDALSRLFVLSNEMDEDGAHIRDTSISIAVSYKILAMKLELLANMAIVMHADERIITNNILGHFEVAYIQSVQRRTTEEFIAHLMALKIKRYVPDYQLATDADLSINDYTLSSSSNEMLVRITIYIADIAPELFDSFDYSQYGATSKLNILLEYIQSTDNPQQRARYTRQFVAEHEQLPNNIQYQNLYMILPYAIEYLPDAVPTLLSRATSQNYFQTLRAYTIAAQHHLEQGDVQSAQQYFERIYARIPTTYPVADALTYYTIYETIYGRQQLMILMLTHRTEPTLSAVRLLVLLQSSLSQPLTPQEQQLLGQIVR